MNRRFRLLATASIVASGLIASSFGTAGASARPAAPATTAGPHIVRFVDSVDPRSEVALLRQSGLGVGRVFENVFPGAVVEGSATATTIKRLKGGVAYTFTVRAVNAVGSSPESAMSNQVVALR